VISTRLFSFNGAAVAIAAIAALAISVPGWRRGSSQWADELVDLRRRLALPLRSGQNPILLATMIIPLWVLIGRIFFFAYQGTPDGGILSGHLASWTDWQAHLTYTASFAFADNTALNLPTASGNNIGYHTGINYFAALLIPGGATLPGSLQLSGAFALFAFPGVMYSVGMRVFRSQATSILGTLLFLFFGGWGFIRFFGDINDFADQGRSFRDLLSNLPRTYTRAPDLAGGHWWIENPIVGHFFPQRPTMIGFPVVLLVLAWLTSAWQALPDRENPSERPGPAAKHTSSTAERNGPDAVAFSEHAERHRTFLFCGVLVGITPFFNLFAFGTPLAFVGAWWLMTRLRREWLWFLIPAVVLALPVVRFLQPPSSTLEFPYNWVGQIIDPGRTRIEGGAAMVGEWFMFWARNLGFFLPLLIVAMAVPFLLRNRTLTMTRQIAIGLLPVWVFFVVPNMIKPHPWNGNNTHYFVFVLLLGALPIASLLVDAVKAIPPLGVVAVALVATMTFSGVLDAIAASDQDTSPFPTTAMDGAGVAVGKWARTTPKDSVFVIELGFGEAAISPHLHPVPAMSGRDVVVGFDGWVFDLGIPDWAIRKDNSRLILEAAENHQALIEQYGVDYLVVGPSHRTPNWDPNIAFWEEQANVVYRHAGWTVYEV